MFYTTTARTGTMLSDLVFLRLPSRTTFAVLAVVTSGASARLEPTGEYLEIENAQLKVVHTTFFKTMNPCGGPN